ncbi:MAG: efflux RND transporter permease subunit [Chloroflexota bacterium]|nr:efflux RND transporter permease subunit [Chloroflexota bacterium]
MRRIVESSLKGRFLVVAVAAGVMALGILQLRAAPVDVFPEFAPPLVEIQTEAPGLSAAEVESLITLNLEELLSGTSWLQTIRSKSVPGVSSILLIFEPGTDVMRARQLVQERLTLAYTLPNIAKPPVILQPLSSTSRLMIVGLSSKQHSLIEQSVVARWTIVPKLMGVPGVANVAIWGQRDWQMQVQIDPAKLRAAGVTQEQIIRTAGDSLWVSPLSFLNASFPGTGGWIDGPNQRLGIRHVLPITTPQDMARVPVDGSKKRLGDVAQVVEGHPLIIGDGYLKDGPGLLLVVEKFPGANTLEVTHGVESALNSLRPGLPGMNIDSTIFRSASFIEMSVANLGTALLIAALLIVLVLGVFLFQWRTALISIAAIVLSLMAAAVVLYLRGTVVNTMVLAGLVIALGVVVDEAIIDIDNIARRIRQRRKEGSDKPTALIILEASLEVRSAIIYATLIIVVAVLPVFFIGGLSGAFFQPLALSYALAVLASTLVALTVTPALSLILLSSAPITRRESRTSERLHARYESALSRILGRRMLLFEAVAVIALAGLLAAPQLGQSLLPTFKERDLLVELAAAPGTSHPEMTRVMSGISAELRSIPGVRTVGAHVGRAMTGDQVVDINASQIWVSIDRNADYDNTVAAIQTTVDGYPGLDGELKPYLKERIRDVLAGADQDVVVRIFGAKRDVLRAKAEEVRQALSGIPGLVDLGVEGQTEEPHVQVTVDLAKAERLGIKPGDVRRAASTVFAGITVGSLFEEQKIFDVAVWGTPETRDSVSDLRELLVDKPGGGHVRLGDVADVRITPTPTVIQHEAIAPRVDVVANVRGRDVGAVVADVQRQLQGIQFPLEYHPEVLGEYAERQGAQNRMLSLAIAAAIAIFLLLHAAFRSWRLATLSFLTLPAALVGGVLALFLTGGAISLGALVGFFTVFGIAARNVIMMITHFQRLERHEGETFGPRLVVRGARERLVPVLLTATTIGVALLPLVVAGEVAGLEIVRPMAIVILGGLVSSTLLNLFVVPALYLAFGSSPEPDVAELAFQPSPEPQLAGGS